jgi:hypothetical protein
MAYEIPIYRFKKNVSREAAKGMMESLNDFLRTAPGFKERRTYHDAQRDVWIDIVEWTSMAEAVQGMEDFAKSPTFTTFLEMVDPDFNLMHHGELIQTFTAAPSA